MEKQLVKLTYNGCIRKVMIDISSYASIERSIATLTCLLPGTFSISYIDDDKEVISFPTSRITQDEFDAFKATKSPIRLIIQKMQNIEKDSKNESTSAASDSLAGEGSQKNSMNKKEEKKPEVNMMKLIGSIFADEQIVLEFQEAIASRQVSELIKSVGIVLQQCENLGDIQTSSLVEILLIKGSLVLPTFINIVERHPQIKEALSLFVSIFGKVFQNTKLIKKLLKFIKKIAFKDRNNGDSSDSDEEAKHSKEMKKLQRRQLRISKKAHQGVVCDGCCNNEKLKEISIRNGNYAEGFGGFICGSRFKSISTYDFDLCESCERTKKFEQSHGPFTKIPKPSSAGQCKWASRADDCDSKSSISTAYVEEEQQQSKLKENEDQMELNQKKGMEMFSAMMNAVKSSTQSVASNTPLPTVYSITSPRYSPSIMASSTKSEEDKLAEKWKPQIELLNSLGFVDWKSYLAILEASGGNVEHTIEYILSS